MEFTFTFNPRPAGPACMRNRSARLYGCTRIYADPQVPYFSHTNLSTNQNQCTIDVRVGCYKQWKKRFAVISDIIIGFTGKSRDF